ncbi:Longin-like domain-containing protein [Lipomyces arxii]|uniref:Longin-like domain-containing protein n=1 Tax=Lipomyces arxii TaxID=56418 RepID=UPI0034CF950E
MTIYSFWIFDRHCDCIFYKDYKRPSRRLQSKPEVDKDKHRGGPATGTSPLSVDDDAKLIFGSVFAIRNLITKLAGSKESFFAFKTSKYKLHFYETQTNLRFVMITDTEAEGVRPILEQVHAGLFVEYVIKNPLSPAEHSFGGVDNELFNLGLDRFLQPLAMFE